MGRGIKVLSLFFIDKVEKYRHEDGTPGVYAGKMNRRGQSKLSSHSLSRMMVL